MYPFVQGKYNAVKYYEARRYPSSKSIRCFILLESPPNSLFPPTSTSASSILFFSGLGNQLWGIGNLPLLICAGAFFAVTTTFVLLTTVLPGIFLESNNYLHTFCPFRSPQSLLFSSLWMKIGRTVEFIRSTLRLCSNLVDTKNDLEKTFLQKSTRGLKLTAGWTS